MPEHNNVTQFRPPQMTSWSVRTHERCGWQRFVLHIPTQFKFCFLMQSRRTADVAVPPQEISQDNVPGRLVETDVYRDFRPQLQNVRDYNPVSVTHPHTHTHSSVHCVYCVGATVKWFTCWTCYPALLY